MIHKKAQIIYFKVVLIVVPFKLYIDMGPCRGRRLLYLRHISVSPKRDRFQLLYMQVVLHKLMIAETGS